MRDDGTAVFAVFAEFVVTTIALMMIDGIFVLCYVAFD